MALTELGQRLLLELANQDEGTEMQLSELAAAVDRDGMQVSQAMRELERVELVNRSILSRNRRVGSYSDPWVSITWLGREQLQKALDGLQEAESARASKVQAEPGWGRRQWARGFARQDVWTAVILLVLLVCALTEWAW